MLDMAWERYNHFCMVYELGGKDVDAILTNIREMLLDDIAPSTIMYREYQACGQSN